MKSTEQMNNTNRPPLFRGRLKRPIAQVLVLALMASSLPAPVMAAFQDKSGSLPGSVSGKTIAIVGVAGGAAIGLLIFYLVKKKKKGRTKLRLDTPPVKFNNVVPGQLTKQAVPVTNIMNDPVTVRP